MPCYSVGGGRYRLGYKGPIYKNKATCERAYKAYLTKKHTKEKHHSAASGSFFDTRASKFKVFK